MSGKIEIKLTDSTGTVNKYDLNDLKISESYGRRFVEIKGKPGEKVTTINDLIRTLKTQHEIPDPIRNSILRKIKELIAQSENAKPKSLLEKLIYKIVQYLSKADFNRDKELNEIETNISSDYQKNLKATASSLGKFKAKKIHDEEKNLKGNIEENIKRILETSSIEISADDQFKEIDHQILSYKSQLTQLSQEKIESLDKQALVVESEKILTEETKLNENITNSKFKLANAISGYNKSLEALNLKREELKTLWESKEDQGPHEKSYWSDPSIEYKLMDDPIVTQARNLDRKERSQQILKLCQEIDQQQAALSKTLKLISNEKNDLFELEKKLEDSKNAYSQIIDWLNQLDSPLAEGAAREIESDAHQEEQAPLEPLQDVHEQEIREIPFQPISQKQQTKSNTGMVDILKKGLFKILIKAQLDINKKQTSSFTEEGLKLCGKQLAELRVPEGLGRKEEEIWNNLILQAQDQVNHLLKEFDIPDDNANLSFNQYGAVMVDSKALIYTLIQLEVLNQNTLYQKERFQKGKEAADIINLVGIENYDLIDNLLASTQTSEIPAPREFSYDEIESQIDELVKQRDAGEEIQTLIDELASIQEQAINNGVLLGGEDQIKFRFNQKS